MTAARGGRLGWDAYRRSVAWMAQARRDAKMSQAELGRLLGWGPGWVTTRETGATRMTRDEVVAVASALGTAVPDLGGTR